LWYKCIYFFFINTTNIPKISLVVVKKSGGVAGSGPSEKITYLGGIQR
jgi:hypothetical protein